jgi:hypothetical protein
VTISRLVALLTPVFAGLSGWIATLAAQYLPGAPTLDQGELTAVFIAGATTAAGAALKWLDGRSKHERAVIEADLAGKTRAQNYIKP